MASYALFRRGPATGRPDAEVAMHDVDVIALGVSPDPYVARQVWAGETLAALGTSLDARAAQWRADAVAAVLAETRRPRVEAWMDAMIAARVAADRRIAH